MASRSPRLYLALSFLSLCVVASSGCLGRESYGDLGRYTLPGGEEVKGEREVIPTRDGRLAASRFMARWQNQRGSSFGGSRWTGGDRGSWAGGTWGRGSGAHGTGAYGHWTNGNGARGSWSGGAHQTGGRYGEWQTGGQPRGTATGGNNTYGAPTEYGERATQGESESGPVIRYRYRGTQGGT